MVPRVCFGSKADISESVRSKRLTSQNRFSTSFFSDQFQLRLGRQCISPVLDVLSHLPIKNVPRELPVLGSLLK